MSNSITFAKSALERMLGYHLEQNDFLRAEWRFLRTRKDFVDLIQIEWRDDSCRAILGVEPRLFPSALREQIPDFTQLAANEWQFQRYVGPPGGFWFNVEGISSDEAIILAQVIEDRIDEARDHFLAHFQTIETFTSHLPEDIDNDGRVLELFGGRRRLAALFYCNLHLWAGDVARAKAFAQFGLAVKKGTIGQQRLQSILQL